VVFCEAEQTLLLLFWKKEYLQLDERFFWGQPQTPWLRFAEKGGKSGFLRSRTNAFASFLEKKNTTKLIVSSGASPDPVALRRREREYAPECI
jgi:hypothetical protein